MGILPDEVTDPTEESDHEAYCKNPCENHFVDEHVDGLQLPVGCCSMGSD
jgi:hypothetical protein